MKATELMIGDWVSQSNGTAVKIDWIKTGEYGYYDKYGKMEIACTPLLEPIPLTAEILMNNGWHRNSIFMELDADENTQFSWANRCGAVLYKNGWHIAIANMYIHCSTLCAYAVLMN